MDQIQNQQIVEQQSPIITQRSFFNKKLIVILVSILFFLVLFTTPFLFYNSQNGQLKALIIQQIQNFQSLDDINTQIVQLVKENVQQEQKNAKSNPDIQKLIINFINSNPLIGSPATSSATSPVLADQTFSYAKQLEREAALDENGVKITTDIVNTDNKINEIYSSSFFKAFLANPKNLTSSTSDTAVKLQKIFVYEGKINTINADVQSYIDDFSSSFFNLVFSNATEQAVAKLKGMITKFDLSKNKVQALSSSPAPKKLLDGDAEGMKNFNAQEQLVSDVIAAYDKKDKEILKKSLIALTTYPSSTSVPFLTFWESDETLNSIAGIRWQWESSKDIYKTFGVVK